MNTAVEAEPQMVLKPCPFCGGEAFTKPNHMETDWLVVCKHASCGRVDGRTKSQAIAAWNTRPSIAGGDEVERAKLAKEIAADVMQWGAPHFKHIVSFNTLCEAIEAVLARAAISAMPVRSDGVREALRGGTGFSWGVGGTDEPLRARATITALLAALGEWKCPECHGERTVRGGLWENDPRVPRVNCPHCEGSGLHPTASAAIARQALAAAPNGGEE